MSSSDGAPGDDGFAFSDASDGVGADTGLLEVCSSHSTGHKGGNARDASPSLNEGGFDFSDSEGGADAAPGASNFDRPGQSFEDSLAEMMKQAVDQEDMKQEREEPLAGHGVDSTSDRAPAATGAYRVGQRPIPATALAMVTSMKRLGWVALLMSFWARYTAGQTHEFIDYIPVDSTCTGLFSEAFIVLAALVQIIGNAVCRRATRTCALSFLINFRVSNFHYCF